MPKMPATSPWMPSTLFSNEKFRSVLLGLITQSLAKATENKIRNQRSETQPPDGNPSHERIHTPSVTQELKVVEHRHALPHGPEELKAEFRGLAHAAIVAVTCGSSVSLVEVDDWVDLLLRYGYSL